MQPGDMLIFLLILFLIIPIIIAAIFISLNSRRQQQNQAWEELASKLGLSFVKSPYSSNSMLSGFYRSRSVTLRADDYLVGGGNHIARMIQTQIIVSLYRLPPQPLILTQKSLQYIVDPEQRHVLTLIFNNVPKASLEIGSHLVLGKGPTTAGLPLDSNWRFLINYLCDLAEILERQSPQG